MTEKGQRVYNELKALQEYKEKERLKKKTIFEFLEISNIVEGELERTVSVITDILRYADDNNIRTNDLIEIINEY